MFGYLKEPSHQDGSFDYLQHMFWLRNEKNIFFVTHLTKGLPIHVAAFKFTDWDAYKQSQLQKTTVYVISCFNFRCIGESSKFPKS